MESGSNKSLYTLIAVVVFGIFLSLSYFLFQDNLKGVLADVMDKTGDKTSIVIENNGLVPTNESYFNVEVLADGSCKITSYTGTSKDVIIPNYIQGKPVTVIGGSAFIDKELNTLVLPYGLLTIEDGGFGSLGTGIGDGVRIGAFAFNNLKSITLPSTLKFIGQYAFYGNQLTSLSTPSSLTTIGPGSFENNQIATLNIASGVKTISSAAFLFNKIESITIPDTVNYIGMRAFACNKLVSINIPSNVTYLGIYAVAQNPLTVIRVPVSLQDKITATKEILAYSIYYEHTLGLPNTFYSDSIITYY